MFHTTQLLLDQASSYEQAGQWQSAVELCESIFDSSWRAGRREDLLEALLKLGFLYDARNTFDVAAEYFNLVATIASRVGDDYREARGLNGLGILYQKSGDLTRAEMHYKAAGVAADRCGDARTTGDVQVNLGIVANVRGEREPALKYYEGALAAYEAAGNRQRVAIVLNNLGILHTDLAGYEAATESLNRATHIARQLGDRRLEGIVLANWAVLQIAEGDFEAARMACDEAFEIASQLADEQLKSEVYKSYGVIFREKGKPFLAESHLKQAIATASEKGLPLLEADAYRELALVLRGEKRNRDALDALNRAHALFVSLQARHHQAEIDRRFAQLEEEFLELVEMWGESIEAKDLYTRGHCQRVAEYACHLALKAGLPDRDLVWFRMGAFLHDVGKTEIPEEILNKPGRLDEDERRLIEHHTIAGDEILSATEFPYDIRPMVRWHHERWDGLGYPDRLSGIDIPFSARILHIVDVYDALTTARSYREPLTRDDALRIMQDDIGSFDPDLFDLFKGIIDDFDQASI